MSFRTTRPAIAAATFLLLSACATLRPSSGDAAERAAADWRMTATRVGVEAAAGRYADVDRLLLDFQRAHPGSAPVAQAAFERAFYKLDPANTTASASDARVLLDSLLPMTEDSVLRSDVLLLRRVAVSLESRPAVVRVPVAAAPSSAPAAAAKPEDLKAKDEEIARLKDDLAKANAELERIRRRLATPKP